jgi:hypothetical protein
MSSLDESEVNEFKELVKKWLSFDDDIRALDKAKKELTKNKKELAEPILAFMAKNSIEDCNTGTGKLKYSVSNSKKPINRQYLTDKLGQYLNNSKKAEEISVFLYDNREVEQKVSLRRCLKKGTSL